jgi:hypothetical protein
MGQLKHFLGGLSCKYFARKPGSVRLGAAPLNGSARARRRNHLERCAACRVREQRERQYLERLRGAAVPAASEDLTARLLARTQELAGQSRQLPARARPLRVAVRIAGGVAATAVLMGGATYVLGGAAAPAADGALSTAFPGQLTVPALSSEAVSGVAWSLGGEPDVAPAGSLSSEQLSALRARGWVGPELRELGYHLVWARGVVAFGSEVLELRLTDGRHFATVLEQHAGGVPEGLPESLPEGQATAGAGQPAPAAPVNLLTGHPATEDGFVAARVGSAGQDGAEPPQDRASTAGTLWVNKQSPFRAIYRTPAATFTYISELPEEQADDGLGALVRSRSGQSVAARSGEGIPARLERGLERIVQLLAR